MHRLNASLVAALVAFVSQPIAPAQTFETVYSLPDPGGRPLGALVKTPTGAFLGTGSSGGAAGFGTIFQVTTQGEVTRLVSFNGENGVSPDGSLTAGTDGNYYGVTRGGGKNDRGTVFRISAAGQLEKLAEFATINEAGPTGSLVEGSDGNFYGFSSGMGSAGLIFKMTPAKVLSVVTRFSEAGTSGKFPTGGLVEREDGSFLGVTAAGGTIDAGVVFKVTKAGVLTRLVDFNGTNGRRPNSLVKGADGNYYGTTEQGGAANCGTVFKITPTDGFSTIASFDFLNGAGPQGRLVESNGTFYGVTVSGGTTEEGTAFKITPSDSTPTIAKIADLGSAVGTFPDDGLVLGNDGDLYGATAYSGGADSGTIIKVTTSGTLTKLADLGAVQGQNLAGGLVVGPDNLLYGAGAFGGAKGAGTLFKLTTGGAFTKLADLDASTTGAGAFSRLIVDADQNLRGVTAFSSRLFSATPGGGIVSAAVSFPAAITSPNGVIQGSDGVFYGTAAGNGTDESRGSVFRYTPETGFQTLFQFGSGNGKTPLGALVEGPDGALYGTTALGGAFNKGTVFRITKGGSFKTLASFSGNNGAQPSGPLVLGRDGNFYGLTQREGPNGTGTVFRVSPTGKLNKLAAFNGFNGAYPAGGLVVGPGGNLYGVAYAGGGVGKFGTVFRVSLSGVVTVLEKFDGATNGAYPTSTLCLGPDGNIYGTTYSTVFRLLTMNRAPVATNDSFELPVIQKKVISNDSDPDKDPLSIVSVTDGAHGTVEFTEDGTVTYLPGPDFDTESAQSDSFTYTISDGLGGTATATVNVTVPGNLFRAGAGAYGGVLALNGSAQGYWALGLTGAGVFTGAIYVDGVKTPIKGFFLSDGTFSQIIPRKAPLTPLTVNLQLDSIRNTITGSVVSGADVYSVELIRNLPIYSSSRPNPNTGRYTVLLTPNNPGELFPQGTGFAKLTVTAKGAVAIVGKLGDGAPFAAGSFISNEGEVPVYAQAYLKKKGYVSGLLTFANLPESDVSGTLSWDKPAQPTDALYPNGFSTNANLIGARYEKASPVLPFAPLSPNGSLVLDSVVTKLITLGTNNVARITTSENSPTKIKIDAKTGVFTGSYVDPNGGARRIFGGAFYQKGLTPRGEGLFFKEAGTGKASIVPVVN